MKRAFFAVLLFAVACFGPPLYAAGSPAWGESFGTADGLMVSVNYLDLSYYPTCPQVLVMTVVIQSADHKPIPQPPEAFLITVIYQDGQGKARTKSTTVAFPPTEPWSAEGSFFVPTGSRAVGVSIRRAMPELMFRSTIDSLSMK